MNALLPGWRSPTAIAHIVSLKDLHSGVDEFAPKKDFFAVLPGCHARGYCLLATPAISIPIKAAKYVAALLMVTLLEHIKRLQRSWQFTRHVKEVPQTKTPCKLLQGVLNLGWLMGHHWPTSILSLTRLPRGCYTAMCGN